MLARSGASRDAARCARAVGRPVNLIARGATGDSVVGVRAVDSNAGVLVETMAASELVTLEFDAVRRRSRLRARQVRVGRRRRRAR